MMAAAGAGVIHGLLYENLRTPRGANGLFLAPADLGIGNWKAGAVPEIQTQIEIVAAPEMVWGILADFAAYPDWNPFVTSIEGAQEVGARLTVRLEPPESRAMTFRPTVRRFEAERELRWLGHLVIPYIFDGEHSFRVEPGETGGTTFHHGEHFSGLLAVPMLWMIRKNTARGFDAMNVALKERAEAAAQA